MKFSPLILSFYLFMLAVTPCTDAQECVPDYMEYQEHDHSDHEDSCSPFCICNCCGITVSFTDILNLNNIEPKHNFHYSFHYSFKYTHDHFGTVWHPPLLS